MSDLLQGFLKGLNQMCRPDPINGSRSGVIYSDDHGATWEYGGATQINMTNNEVCDSPAPSPLPPLSLVVQHRQRFPSWATAQ